MPPDKIRADLDVADQLPSDRAGEASATCSLTSLLVAERQVGGGKAGVIAARRRPPPEPGVICRNSPGCKSKTSSEKRLRGKGVLKGEILDQRRRADPRPQQPAGQNPLDFAGEEQEIARQAHSTAA